MRRTPRARALINDGTGADEPASSSPVARAGSASAALRNSTRSSSIPCSWKYPRTAARYRILPTPCVRAVRTTTGRLGGAATDGVSTASVRAALAGSVGATWAGPDAARGPDGSIGPDVQLRAISRLPLTINNSNLAGRNGSSFQTYDPTRASSGRTRTAGSPSDSTTARLKLTVVPVQ